MSPLHEADNSEADDNFKSGALVKELMDQGDVHKAVLASAIEVATTPFVSASHARMIKTSTPLRFTGGRKLQCQRWQSFVIKSEKSWKDFGIDIRAEDCLWSSTLYQSLHSPAHLKSTHPCFQTSQYCLPTRTCGSLDQSHLHGHDASLLPLLVRCLKSVASCRRAEGDMLLPDGQV